MDPEALLRQMFAKAVAAAQPAGRLEPFLPQRPKGRTIVVGAGKAAASMAAALEAEWPHPLEGLVVTRRGHLAPTRQIEVVEASHPVPDEAGALAATRVLELARSAGPDDLLIVLLSGGASALLFQPLPPLGIDDKRRLIRDLLASGATINQINCVRKHLSSIKGGRLALAAKRAEIVTLAISDVVGDDPAVIGSGPTYPDPTTQAEATEILSRYRIAIGPEIAAILADRSKETPKAADFANLRHTYHLIASPSQSLAAAEQLAEKAGIRTINDGDAVEGEARDFGRQLAKRAKRIADEGLRTPTLLLSGGELTVTIANRNGRGGPNAECALAFLDELRGAPGIFGLFADSDGIDGSEDNAGAIVIPESFDLALKTGLDPEKMLAENLSYDFFNAIGGLLLTGPTLTNVNDFRAVMVMPAH